MYLENSRKYIRKVIVIALIILATVTVYDYNNFRGMMAPWLRKIEFESLSDEQLHEFFDKQRTKRSDEQLHQFYDKERGMRHIITVEKYFRIRKSWVTSNLGSILFKNSLAPQPKNRTFTVFVWKYYDWLKERHMNGFGHGRENPLDDCSVKNCIFTGGDTRLNKKAMPLADAVLVHIQAGKIPKVKQRNPKQRWVFLSDESPVHTFTKATFKPILRDWKHIFNWSMTYRSDADVPVPYGRTLPLKSPLMPNILPETIAKYVPYWKNKRRDVLVTVLMSNCRVVSRMKYLKELQQHINVTVFGKCSEDKKLSCPGHIKEDCKILSEYLFYLVLENSQCRQYLTEKGFHNAYSKGAIPVIMGPPPEDCKKLLPPNSYLHVDDYDSAQALANEIKTISNNEHDILAYHRWRNDFRVVNEHGYFGNKSYHYCRLCEALNYNSETRKSYSLLDLELFLNTKLLCT